MGFTNLVNLGLDSTYFFLESTYRKVENKTMDSKNKARDLVTVKLNLSIINLCSISVMCKSAHFLISN